MNENELKAEINKLKNNMGVLVDVLFIIQKQYEQWLSKVPEGELKDEFSDMVLALVKARMLAKGDGAEGHICKKCKDKKCEDCTLENILI